MHAPRVIGEGSAGYIRAQNDDEADDISRECFGLSDRWSIYVTVGTV